MRAEHVGLYAKDTSALCKWYMRILGFSIVNTIEKEGRPPIFFIKGESEVVIEILPTQSDRVARELMDPGFSHLGILVDDFEQTVTDLESNGVSVFDVRSTSTGWTIGYLDDPEGNRLEIVYRP